MWHDSDDTIMNIFDDACAGKTKFPSDCPICKGRQAHIYMHRHNPRHGGIWMWCSSCRAYAHMSGIIPDWWENPGFTDEALLEGEPSVLDDMAVQIDRWVNGILPVNDMNDMGIFENRRPGD